MDIIGPHDISVVHTPQQAAPTLQQYGALNQIFTHFNHALFDDRLPLPVITLQRQRNTLGFYCASRFVAMNGDDTRVDELMLNPAFFRARGPRDVCSTVAHEQCHAVVRHFGKPTRVGYHDRQWAEVMKHIGLQPSSTGQPGGREVGYKMDHIIVENGPFDRAFDELIRTTTIAWGDALPQDDRPRPKSKRLKFICPCCAFSAQAVPSAAGKLACIPCGHTEMVAAE